MVVNERRRRRETLFTPCMQCSILMYQYDLLNLRSKMGVLAVSLGSRIRAVAAHSLPAGLSQRWMSGS